MTVKIDYDIPIPDTVKGTQSKYRWLSELADAPVGASVFLGTDEPPKTVQVRIHARIKNAKEEGRLPPDFKVVTRAVEGGLRVWKTSE